jgi:hypothetical protein
LLIHNCPRIINNRQDIKILHAQYNRTQHELRN